MQSSLPAKLGQEFCREFHIFPQLEDVECGCLIFDDRSDLSVLDYVCHVVQAELVPKRAAEGEIDLRIAEYFSINDGSGQCTSVSTKVPPLVEEPEGKIVQRINSIVRDGIDRQASDIHFEPRETGMECRMRLDGVLTKREEIDRTAVPEVISRLKIMAGLDIAEKRRPQDGRIRFDQNGRLVDIRVSIIPTDFGEKAVLRILDKESLRLDLNALGFSPDQLMLFQEKITQPNGIILVTGPTGSGKTTTLYAALNHLRSPQVNISTVEDPIEYNLPGINQTQVRPEIDLTFAAMLRALLRQDPNIIMVGEIRDWETLEIAVRASLTGHLVLSTVHTNSAIATITRLLDMGAEPFLLASTLRLIVGQRLVRLNCRNCDSSEISDTNRAAAFKLDIKLGPGTRNSLGCERCRQTAFSGRRALYELLAINDSLKEAIGKRATESELLAIALSHGFSTMLQSGQALVNGGQTTPSEVLREVGS